MGSKMPSIKREAEWRKPSGERLLDKTPDGLENGWINRFGIGNESVLQRRSSSSLWPWLVR